MNDAGFYIEENIISHPNCEVIIQAIPFLEHNCNIAGIRHLMSNNTISRLANDPRLLSIPACMFRQLASWHKHARRMRALPDLSHYLGGSVLIPILTSSAQ